MFCVSHVLYLLLSNSTTHLNCDITNHKSQQDKSQDLLHIMSCKTAKTEDSNVVLLL